MRETISTSIRRLKIQQVKISRVSFRLEQRNRNLFQTCVQAIDNHDKGRANICANEAAEIRKLIRFLYHVDLAIERVILRLETIRELSDIIIDLKPALRMLRKVSKQLFAVLPDVSSELGRVKNTIDETLHSTRLRADESIIPVNKLTQGGEEVLGEVSTFLERQLVEKLPEPPETIEVPKEAPVSQVVALAATCSQAISEEAFEMDEQPSGKLLSFKRAKIEEVFKRAKIEEVSLKVEKSNFEDVLLDYVKKSEGEVDLRQCSLELNSSRDEIEKALQRLGAKGKIVIEKQEAR